MGKKRGYDRQDDSHANWVLTSSAARRRAKSDSQVTLAIEGAPLSGTKTTLKLRPRVPDPVYGLDE